jgi:hypothetical protein
VTGELELGGLTTLVCPPGAQDAAISHGEVGYWAYREHGRSGLWLVDVPLDAAVHLCKVGGFRQYQPPAPKPPAEVRYKGVEVAISLFGDEISEIALVDGSFLIESDDLAGALISGYAAAAPVSVAAGLIAAGNSRATATPLPAIVNVAGSVPLGSGFVLENLQPGQSQSVFNGGANTATVYGVGATTIDGVAGATGVPLSAGKRCRYLCVAPGVVISAQLGAASA